MGFSGSESVTRPERFPHPRPHDDTSHITSVEDDLLHSCSGVPTKVPGRSRMSIPLHWVDCFFSAICVGGDGWTPIRDRPGAEYELYFCMFTAFRGGGFPWVLRLFSPIGIYNGLSNQSPSPTGLRDPQIVLLLWWLEHLLKSSKSSLVGQSSTTIWALE